MRVGESRRHLEIFSERIDRRMDVVDESGWVWCPYQIRPATKHATLSSSLRSWRLFLAQFSPLISLCKVPCRSNRADDVLWPHRLLSPRDCADLLGFLLFTTRHKLDYATLTGSRWYFRGWTGCWALSGRLGDGGRGSRHGAGDDYFRSSPSSRY